MSVKAEDTSPSSPVWCPTLSVWLLDLYLKGSNLPHLASLGGGKNSALVHLNQLVVGLFFLAACPDAEGHRLSTADLPGKTQHWCYGKEGIFVLVIDWICD